MARFVRAPDGQALLIDADDTLWENNIYFERAIATFIAFLDHQQYSPSQVRTVLLEIGRRFIASHGYGTRSFALALVGTYERLSSGPVTPELREKVRQMALPIEDHPVELLPRVGETLEYLCGRHRLILMTKGDVREQMGKIERSGLKGYFAAVEIVARKDRRAFHSAASKHGLAAESTWMVGNSPRSDINPARAAGLNAVFVPHSHNSMFEHEALAPAMEPPRLLQLESFSELQDHF
jgi:putative hydrolase of the HAD superfamily